MQAENPWAPHAPVARALAACNTAAASVASVEATPRPSHVTSLRSPSGGECRPTPLPVHTRRPHRRARSCPPASSRCALLTKPSLQVGRGCFAAPPSPSPASCALRLPPASRGRPLCALDSSACFKQSLHRLRMRWCSQMLPPPQSLHRLRMRWCSQKADPPQSLQ